jgi:hypothetical protein
MPTEATQIQTLVQGLQQRLQDSLPVKIVQVRFKAELEAKYYPLKATAIYRGGLLDEVRGLSSTSGNRKPEEIQARLPFPNRLVDMAAFSASMQMLEFEEKSEEEEEDSKGNSELGKKIAVFRLLWEEVYKTKLVIRKNDRKDWEDAYKHIPANAKEIYFYLRTNTYPIKGNKSISDYCRHYEDVLRMMKSETATADFPNVWDPQYFDHLSKTDMKRRVEYIRHLKGLGYSKKMDNTGRNYYAKEHQ